MPRFYFDVTDGEALVEDSQGTELGRIETAEREAIISAAEINRDNARLGKVHTVTIKVRDEIGRVIATAVSSLSLSRPPRIH